MSGFYEPHGYNILSGTVRIHKQNSGENTWQVAVAVSGVYYCRIYIFIGHGTILKDQEKFILEACYISDLFGYVIFTL